MLWRPQGHCGVGILEIYRFLSVAYIFFIFGVGAIFGDKMGVKNSCIWRW
jgi:hypothetical protein